MNEGVTQSPLVQVLVRRGEGGREGGKEGGGEGGKEGGEGREGREGGSGKKGGVVCQCILYAVCRRTHTCGIVPARPLCLPFT